MCACYICSLLLYVRFGCGGMVSVCLLHLQFTSVCYVAMITYNNSSDNNNDDDNDSSNNNLMLVSYIM